MKTKIVTYLKENLNYSPTDDIYISELLFNIDILEECKKALKKDKGLDLCSNITRNQYKESFLQRNRYISIYDSALGNVLRLTKELGLSPVIRKKLKLLESSAKDVFDEFFTP